MGRQRVLISAEADQVLSPPVMSSEVETSLTSLAMSSQLFALCVRQKLQVAGPTQGLSLSVTPRIRCRPRRARCKKCAATIML